jgi:hypothetical protein
LINNPPLTGAAPERRKLRTVCQPTVFEAKDFAEKVLTDTGLVASAQQLRLLALAINSVVSSF